MPRSLCSVEGCDRPTKAKGLCDKHYKRLWRHGNIADGRTTPEGRERMAAAKRGRTLPESQRQRIAESLRRSYAEGRRVPRHGPISEAHKEALLRANTGRPSPRKGKVIPLDQRAWSKKHKQTPEAIAKIGAASREHWQDPDYRARIIAISRERWQDPEYRARGLAYLSDIRGPTSIETAIAAVLEALGITFEQQKVIGPFICDIFVPSLNLDIECDGSYWHALPEMKKRDRKRDSWFRRHGYRVLRLSESEIRSNAEQAVVAGLSHLG